MLGCFYGSTRTRIDMPRLIDFYVDGRLLLDELVTRTYPLEQINEAFDDLGQGGVGRGLLLHGMLVSSPKTRAVETAPGGGCGRHETALRRLGPFVRHCLSGTALPRGRPNPRRRVSWRPQAPRRGFNRPPHPAATLGPCYSEARATGRPRIGCRRRGASASTLAASKDSASPSIQALGLAYGQPRARRVDRARLAAVPLLGDRQAGRLRTRSTAPSRRRARAGWPSATASPAKPIRQVATPSLVSYRRVASQTLAEPGAPLNSHLRQWPPDRACVGTRSCQPCRRSRRKCPPPLRRAPRRAPDHPQELHPPEAPQHDPESRPSHRAFGAARARLVQPRRFRESPVAVATWPSRMRLSASLAGSPAPARSTTLLRVAPGRRPVRPGDKPGSRRRGVLPAEFVAHFAGQREERSSQRRPSSWWLRHSSRREVVRPCAVRW